MNPVRPVYRVRQFFDAVLARPRREQQARARDLLPERQFELFRHLAPFEQAHALRVLELLRERGHTHPDLLAAALLHDVGKTRHPLRLWERVLVVLGRALFPDRVGVWGRGEPRGWRRAFVVSEQHPVWGAEMAAAEGASPLAARLIRRHQERPPVEAPALENGLLAALQAADDER